MFGDVVFYIYDIWGVRRRLVVFGFLLNLGFFAVRASSSDSEAAWRTLQNAAERNSFALFTQGEAVIRSRKRTNLEHFSMSNPT